MVFRIGKKPIYYLRVPTRTGWVRRSTGTTDRATAKAIERMLDILGPKGARAWDLLDLVALKDKALPLGRLFDSFRLNALDRLHAELADVDLTVYINGWRGWLLDRVGDSTREHYLAHLRALMPAEASYWRSGFTAPAVAQWLATRTGLVQKRKPSLRGRRREDGLPRPVSGSTRRKYLAAVQSFSTYLRAMGILDHIQSPAYRDRRPPRRGWSSWSCRR